MKNLFLNPPADVVPVRSHSLTGIQGRAPAFDLSCPSSVHVSVNFTLEAFDQSCGNFRTFLFGQPKGFIEQLFSILRHVR